MYLLSALFSAFFSTLVPLHEMISVKWKTTMDLWNYYGFTKNEDKSQNILNLAYPKICREQVPDTNIGKLPRELFLISRLVFN